MRWLVAGLCAWLSLSAVQASAQDGQAADARAASERVAFALGVSMAAELRRDYGAATRASFAPELLGLGYLPVAFNHWFLRLALRVGYDGLVQPEMPRSLRVEEHGLHELFEVGLLFDFWFVPVLSVGGGLIERWIDLETDGAVEGNAGLDRSEVLGVVYGSLGVGIPLARGLFVLEPFVRVQHVANDDRAPVRLGLDLTVRL